MSITICYEPVNEKPLHFKTNVSAYYNVLEKTFPNFTITISDVPKLQAMSIAANTEFYNEVADIIEDIGSINFWSQW